MGWRLLDRARRVTDPNDPDKWIIKCNVRFDNGFETSFQTRARKRAWRETTHPTDEQLVLAKDGVSWISRWIEVDEEWKKRGADQLDQTWYDVDTDVILSERLTRHEKELP